MLSAQCALLFGSGPLLSCLPVPSTQLSHLAKQAGGHTFGRDQTELHSEGMDYWTPLRLSCPPNLLL